MPIKKRVCDRALESFLGRHLDALKPNNNGFWSNQDNLLEEDDTPTDGRASAGRRKVFPQEENANYKTLATNSSKCEKNGLLDHGVRW